MRAVGAIPNVETSFKNNFILFRKKVHKKGFSRNSIYFRFRHLEIRRLVNKLNHFILLSNLCNNWLNFGSIHDHGQTLWWVGTLLEKIKGGGDQRF